MLLAELNLPAHSNYSGLALAMIIQGRLCSAREKEALEGYPLARKWKTASCLEAMATPLRVAG
jgi:hypothetical protein